jgi:hypothetical protein
MKSLLFVLTSEKMEGRGGEAPAEPQSRICARLQFRFGSHPPVAGITKLTAPTDRINGHDWGGSLQTTLAHI